MFTTGTDCFICSGKSYREVVTNSYGKVVAEIIKEKKPKRTYTKAKITSAFPGGDSARVKWLEETLNQSISFCNGAKRGKYLASAGFILTKELNGPFWCCVPASA